MKLDPQGIRRPTIFCVALSHTYGLMRWKLALIVVYKLGLFVEINFIGAELFFCFLSQSKALYEKTVFFCKFSFWWGSKPIVLVSGGGAAQKPAVKFFWQQPRRKGEKLSVLVESCTNIVQELYKEVKLLVAACTELVQLISLLQHSKSQYLK